MTPTCELCKPTDKTIAKYVAYGVGDNGKKFEYKVCEAHCDMAMVVGWSVKSLALSQEATTEQTDKCRTCNGAGRVIFIHGDRYNRSYREMQICPTCNGGSLFVGSLSLLAEGPTLINPPLLDYIQWSESERERKRTATAE